MTDGQTTPGDAETAASDLMTTFLREALEAQQRAISQAQDWSISTMAAYREQAEEHTALLRAVDRSLRATEDLLESQARATKALSESLDASRQLMETLVGSHQRGMDRLERMIAVAVEQVGGQLQASTPRPGLADSGSGPFAAQNAAYLNLTKDWLDALNGFMGGGLAARANDESSPRH
jgi:hypothetical protein